MHVRPTQGKPPVLAPTLPEDCEGHVGASLLQQRLASRWAPHWCPGGTGLPLLHSRHFRSGRWPMQGKDTGLDSGDRQVPGHTGCC